MAKAFTATLVTSSNQLEARIREYQGDLEELAERMPYNRAWYAVRQGEGWMFGPSKFVGYDEMTAKEYLEREKGILDGRVTEKVLQQWSELVEEGHPQYEELNSALGAFCARYGKKPNSLARVSIVNAKQAPSASGPTFPDELVALMAAVYRKLTPAQKSAFHKHVA
jgi:hypothetical protein